MRQMYFDTINDILMVVFFLQVEDFTNKAIICDLGVAVLKNNVPARRDGANPGSLKYQHVEQLLGLPQTPGVDVYSFGVIALEMYTREGVWKGLSHHQIKRNIEKGKFPIIPVEKVPEKVKQMITRCFQPVEKRPSVTELFPLLLSLVKDQKK